MSVKAEYDIEFVEGEASGDADPYLITLKNKDGTPANISWAEEIELIISTKELEQKFVATLSDGDISVMGNVIVWPMKEEQTSGYNGEHIAQVICSTTDALRIRKTYLMSVMVYPRTDEAPAP